MNINFKKLNALGFRTELSKDRTEVAIYPSGSDPEVQRTAHELCDLLGLNTAEHDEIFSTIHRVQVMSAIRKTSNW